MKYKAVLFDMDGVILDSEPLHVAAFRAVIKNYGHDLSDDQYKEYFAGRTDKAGFEQYFRFISETVDLPVIMGEKTRTYLELASDQLQPYPGVASVIRELSRSSALALVTGSLKAEVDVALKACGVEGLFNIIITAEDVNRGKPDPEGYRQAVQRLGLTPDECVVVEDSPSGIAAANAAGVAVIAVCNTHEPEELSGATKIVEQLSLASFDS